MLLSTLGPDPLDVGECIVAVAVAIDSDTCARMIERTEPYPATQRPLSSVG